MWLLASTLATVSAALLVAVMRARHRLHDTDLGAMSTQWLAEHLQHRPA